MDIPISIVLTVFGIAITLTIAYFGFVKDVVQRLTKLEANDKLYWAAISPHLATIIHSPTHKDRDSLVDKLVDGSITRMEAMELACMLEQNIHENHDEGKKLASALLLARTKMLIAARSK
jgi:hypothetical protein